MATETVLYYLNGVALTQANGLLPSRHEVVGGMPQVIDTIGGMVEVEPPMGLRMVVTWHYDGRPTRTVDILKEILVGSNQCVITCPDTRRDAAGKDVMITGLRCLVQLPNFVTAGHRKDVDTFSLVFTERQAS